MSVETFEFDPDAIVGSIKVSAEAELHFAKQLQGSDNTAIRLSLKESGCSGYMYVIEEVSAAEDSDKKRCLNNGVELYVASTHLAKLRDLEVDYVKKGLNYNLVLNNPNSKHACGCGESFSF